MASSLSDKVRIHFGIRMLFPKSFLWLVFFQLNWLHAEIFSSRINWILGGPESTAIWKPKHLTQWKICLLRIVMNTEVISSHSSKTYFFFNFLIFQVFLNSSWLPPPPYVFLILIACCCAENKFYSCWLKCSSLFHSGYAAKQLWCLPVQIKNKLIFWCLWVFFLYFFLLLSFNMTILVQFPLYAAHSSIKTVPIVYCSQCENELKIVEIYILLI